MRLQSIKLAGFKSFVDPTVLHFNSNLVAIVGPNGCGKSNIVDAIRWVIGESSAKHLRGQSLTDVIFKGASTRKPVGKAAIELTFTDCQGVLPGELSAYHEICVRREINQEGLSLYFLNGVRCRRRDIMDVFLGTGLGPRSYAVIEQGTINTFIEAKPEVLRAHLEDVAGISKYKERRAETQKRIEQTRENLVPLHSTIDELNAQLARLKRQAHAAARYKTLKQEERAAKAQLFAMDYRNFDQERLLLQTNSRQMEVTLEAQLAQLTHIETNRTEHRLKQEHKQVVFDEAQRLYYSTAAQVGTLEQRLAQDKGHIRKTQETISSLLAQHKTLEETLQTDQAKRAHLSQMRPALERQVEALGEEMAQRQAELAALEQQYAHHQSQWDIVSQQHQKFLQSVHVENNNIMHLEQRSRLGAEQIERLTREQAGIDVPAAAEITVRMHNSLEERRRALDHAQAALDVSRQTLSRMRLASATLDAQLRETHKQLHVIKTRYLTLKNLEETQRATSDAQFGQWLSTQHWDRHPRLLEVLEVETGWERALHIVLGPFLEAVCLEEEITLSPETLCTTQPLTTGCLSLLEKKSPLSAHSSHPARLADKVKSPWPLSERLMSIYIAKTPVEAFAMRCTLQAHESVITPCGLWLGPTWVQLNKKQAHEVGGLERQKELHQLKHALEMQEAEGRRHEVSILEHQAALETLEETYQAQQTAVSTCTVAYTQAHTELSTHTAKHQALEKRASRMEQELQEARQGASALLAELAAAQARLAQAEDGQGTLLAQKNTLQSLSEQTKMALKTERQQLQDTQKLEARAQRELTEIVHQIQRLMDGIDRVQQQGTQLQDQAQALTETCQEAHQNIPVLEAELEAALANQMAAERAAQGARIEKEQIELTLKAFEKNRTDIERALNHTRGQLEDTRIKIQTLLVQTSHIQAQIAELDLDITTILQGLQPSDAKRGQEKIEAIAQEIQRLGAINLVAIEEYEQGLERKVHLDQQVKDITEALLTLEHAIRKIDQETCSRFEATFHQVNEHFQALFPKIFGGGQASLTLTDPDLLVCGVDLMAQPPGKRNSTIHLLSGGEKALTAICLVFALFEVIPAPFCILDEVDAPLDDANVARFCALVKSMSSRVQFIYISHNRLTIAMANELAGITMQERGISRLVSVNVEKALSMTDT